MKQARNISSEKLQLITETINYLNRKTNASFRVSDEAVRHIEARINEGYTLEDFKLVIDLKASQWLGNETMEQYLRPRTLFCGKFEDYLQHAKRQRQSLRHKSQWNFEGSFEVLE